MQEWEPVDMLDSLQQGLAPPFPLADHIIRLRYSATKPFLGLLSTVLPSHSYHIPVLHDQNLPLVSCVPDAEGMMEYGL
jgi:hypothetical protein